MLKFVGAAKKIIRANALLDELIHKVRALASEVVASYVKCDDGSQDYLVNIEHGDTEEIPLICGDIIHNIRASLDYMIFDVALICGTPERKMQFPITKSEESFHLLLNKKNDKKPPPFLKLPDYVIQLICEVKPYNGGYPYIYPIHELDIHDKHRSILVGYEYFTTQPNSGDVIRNLMIEQTGIDSGPIMVLGEMPAPIRHGEKVSPIAGMLPEEIFPLGDIKFNINIVGDFVTSGQQIFPMLGSSIIWFGRLIHNFAEKFGEEKNIENMPIFREIIRM